jgi:hypothetical protein
MLPEPAALRERQSTSKSDLREMRLISARAALPPAHRAAPVRAMTALLCSPRISRQGKVSPRSLKVPGTHPLCYLED